MTTDTNNSASPASAVGSSALVARKYRLLQSRDVVEATDEYLQDDCETWQKIHDESNPTGSGLMWFVGREYHSSIHQPIRRPIRATAEVCQPEGGKKL